jgi:hypothetical protein
LRAVVLGCALVGALLLVVSEFTTLFTIRSATGATLKSISTHSHDSYALIPIALVAVGLAWGAVASGSRWALIALGGVGLVALLIALIGDLPDAQATGTIIAAGHYAAANDHPGAGLYLESFGAIVLVIAAGCGLLLSGEREPAAPAAAASSGSRPEAAPYDRERSGS